MVLLYWPVGSEFVQVGQLSSVKQSYTQMQIMKVMKKLIFNHSYHKNSINSLTPRDHPIPKYWPSGAWGLLFEITWMIT